MGYAALESKLAHSAALVVLSLEIEEGIAVIEGQSSDDKVERQITCVAEGGQEMEPGTGVFGIPLTVTIRFPAAIDTDGVDPKEAFDACVATVRDGLFDTNIAATLTGLVEDFTAQGYLDPSISAGTSGDMFKASFTVQIVCCASDL